MDERSLGSRHREVRFDHEGVTGELLLADADHPKTR
jgi:hypothetical protein